VRGDVQDLADKILRLCDDPARRRAMGLAGRTKVDASFDLRKNVGQLLEVYGIPEAGRFE